VTLYFSLKARVTHASDSLIKYVCRHNNRAIKSKNGTLVVPLAADYKVSRKRFPTEWGHAGSHTGSFGGNIPRFAVGVVHKVYTPPAQLVGVTYKLLLEGKEISVKEEHYQIVTGFDGESMKPFRRANDRDDSHPTALAFTGETLGMVRFDKATGLTIHRAAISTTNGLITMDLEELVRDTGFPALSDQTNQFLGVNPQWVPALRALVGRIQCDRTLCDGHYYS